MKDTKKENTEQSEMGLSLEALIRRGARELMQKAIEVEVQELLAEYGKVRTLHGQRAVVRNGYLPAREVLTSVGHVEVKVPKVRDRLGAGVKFNSALVPPFVRRSARMSAALPWLAWQLLGIRHEVAADLHDLQAQLFKARTARFNCFVVRKIRDAELHRKLEERLH